MRPEYLSRWQRRLIIPDSLIGPERPVRRSTMQSTTLPWGKPLQAGHTELTFWDPELMHEWTLQAHERADGQRLQAVNERRTRGVLVRRGR
jgi:hypothetical protein